MLSNGSRPECAASRTCGGRSAPEPQQTDPRHVAGEEDAGGLESTTSSRGLDEQPTNDECTNEWSTPMENLVSRGMGRDTRPRRTRKVGETDLRVKRKPSSDGAARPPTRRSLAKVVETDQVSAPNTAGRTRCTKRQRADQDAFGANVVQTQARRARAPSSRSGTTENRTSVADTTAPELILTSLAKQIRERHAQCRARCGRAWKAAASIGRDVCFRRSSIWVTGKVREVGLTRTALMSRARGARLHARRT